MFCVPDELRRKTGRRKHLLLGQKKSETTLETKAEVWRHGGRTLPSTTSAFLIFFYYYAKEMRLLACDCEFSSFSCVCKALLSVPSCFMLH